MGPNWIYLLLLALDYTSFREVLSTDVVHCQTCPKGQGVVQSCNTTSNTICQICPQDTYSNVESAFEECRPCSLCGRGLYEMRPCTRTSDTFCELCSWQDAVPNEDYKRKCRDDSLVNVIGDTKGDYEDEDTESMSWLLGDEPPKAPSQNNHRPEPVAGQQGGDVDAPKLPAQLKDTSSDVDSGKSDKHDPNPPKTDSSDKGGGDTKPEGPRVGGVGVEVNTIDPSKTTKATNATEPQTTPYTGPKPGGIGVDIKTQNPKLTTRSTLEPYTGPKIAKIGVKQKTQDPKKTTVKSTTRITTTPYTGPKVGGINLVQKTHDPKATTEKPTVPYTGPKVGGMGVVRRTYNPKKTTGLPTTKYTGPKVAEVGIKRRTFDPRKTTVTTKEPYTGPKVDKFALLVKTHDPKKTTITTKEPYTGPKVQKFAVKVKTHDPKKTTVTTKEPYTGPKVDKFAVKIKTHDPRKTTVTTKEPYTGPKVDKVAVQVKSHDPKKTTVTTKEPYTGPKVDKFAVQVKTRDPKKTTVTTKEPYTGPKVGKVAVQIKTRDPKKTTLTTKEPYTGPKVDKVVMEVKTRDPKITRDPKTTTPTTKEPYTGPRIAKGVELERKTFDPQKTTRSTLTPKSTLEPYTGPKVAEKIGIVIKRRTTTISTTVNATALATTARLLENTTEPELVPEISGDGEPEVKPIVPKGEAREMTDPPFSGQFGHTLGGGGADAKAAHQKHPSSDKNAAKKKGTGVSIFSISMVALAVGVVFFVVGFAVDRWRHRRKHTSSQYELAAETPSMPAQEMVYRTPIYMEKKRPTPAIVHEESELTEVPAAPLEAVGEAQSKSQSPINIDTDDVDPDVTLGNNPLLFKYMAGSTNIVNTGHTIRVLVDGQGSSLSGGPFLPKYELHHVEFTWGSNNSKGSEHTVNGAPAAAEAQLVHWNCKDYKSFEAAEKGEDGLAVLSVLIKVGQQPHEGVQKVTDCLPSIQFKGESHELQANEFDPASLLPASTSLYWTYIGSTTSQPYHESVTWVVFKDAIEVTSEQLDEFRKLRPYHKDEERLLRAPDNEFLVDNFRPVQPIGDRTIRASFV